MKYIFNLFIVIWSIAAWGQEEGDGFNPPNPGEPGQRYNLIVRVIPEGAGNVSPSDEQQYVSGEGIWLDATPHANYLFVGWEENGDTISRDQSYYYLIPARNTTINAVFRFNPQNPNEPSQDNYKYELGLTASPVEGGRFNLLSGDEFNEGESVSLYAYPEANYQFEGWKSGDTVLSVENPYVFFMGKEDVHITGVFRFNPVNPGNPNANHWDEKTKSLIVDDFVPGRIMDAVDQVIGGSGNRSKVSMVTVSGMMQDGDFGIADYLSNCIWLDLSRTGGYSQIPYYAFDYANLQTVILPSCVERIESGAFYNCTNLSDITCYALTPPVVDFEAFEGIVEGAVVHVLSSAIPLYEVAEGWKDFTILPLTEDVKSLEVRLPSGSEGMYKNMILELQNLQNGQKQRYVVSDRLNYTFNGLLKNCTYQVCLKTSAGVVLGQIENIEVKEEDLSVSFTSLLALLNVGINVQTPDKTDVSGQTLVTWLDSKQTYLAQGSQLKGQTTGTELIYRIGLNQELGMQYKVPEDQTFHVQDKDTVLIYTLTPLQMVTLSGLVKDVNGNALSGATVSVSQKLNGKYSKSFIGQTDAKGQFAMQVFNDQSTIAVSAPDYISQTLEMINFDEGTDLGVIQLKKIAGATLNIRLTYTPSVAAGTEATTEDWYSDYSNVMYSIYNETKQEVITDFVVQYPIIVLLDEVAEGDQLRLTASSKNNAFEPVIVTAHVDADLTAAITIPLVGLGGIQATYQTTDNAGVVGMLYDSKGELLKKYSYSNGTLSIPDLASGTYTLISMCSSDFFNSILKLSALEASGLVEGTDYIKNTVSVSSGVISLVTNENIPALDESKLYYTGENTSFTVNKASIVTGNYLTLKGQIDFKAEYASEVSNVRLLVDLPASCSFVENSVMTGSQVSAYTLDGSRLTVALNDYREQVRFCVIPTVGGTYAPNAFVEFTLNGKTVQQPIGSAYYEVKDLSISVPETVARTTIPVSGTAQSNSEVRIYDNDILIGQTTTLANGIWSVVCELNEPYNLSTHSIYAKVTTRQGLELQSETQEVMYDTNTVEARTVTMTFYNGWLKDNVEVVFDFQKNSTSTSSYMFYTATDITFIADLTNNHPDTVSNVTLYVWTDKNEVREIPLKYDSKTGKWIGISYFTADNLPINLDISITADSPVCIDRERFSIAAERFSDGKAEAQDFLQNLDSLQLAADSIDSALTQEDEKLQETLVSLEEAFATNADSKMIDSLYTSLGYVINDLQPDIPDDADKQWLDKILDTGDSLLAVTIDKSVIQEAEELVEKADLMLNDTTGLDIVASYQTLLQDSLSVTTEDGKEATIYRTTLDKLSPAYIQEADTVTLEMTEGAPVRIYFGHEDKYAVIADAARNEALVVISQSIVYSMRKMSALANSDDDGFISVMMEAKGELDLLISSITSVIAGWVDECDDKIKNTQAIIADLENQRTVILGRSAGCKILINDIEKQIRTLKAQEVVDINEYQRLKEQITALEVKRATLIQDFKRWGKISTSLEKKLGFFKPKLFAAAAAFFKVQELTEVVKGFYTLIHNISYAIEDRSGWMKLIEAIEPCEGDEAEARALKMACQDDWSNIAWRKGYYPSVAFTSVTAVVNSVLFVRKDVQFLAGFLIGVITNFINETAEVMFENAKSASRRWYPKRYAAYKALDCQNEKDDKNEPPKPDNEPDTQNGDNGRFDPIRGIHDPSGYVYEAVETNRLPGVTATCYYKEMVEDMYGDLHEQVVLWNAAEYAQQNPLFTDENGMYRWDVPQGLWQVKFEKEGYQTTYSEWLPVPPPQLEVNIGMVQTVQPNVEAVRGYETGVEVDFSKFMLPETMTPEFISITCNGEAVSGEVIFKNAETNPQDKNTQYVSKVRFVPERELATTDRVILTVNKRVKSYAGIQMESDFSQEIPIEKEPKAVMKEEIEVVYNRTAELTVVIDPAETAAGKKVTALSASSAIATIEPAEAILNEEGKAVFTVTGELPGQTILKFVVEGTDMQPEVKVNVVEAGKESITQRYTLAAGWNWISVNVQAEHLNDLPALLSSIKDAALTVKSADCELVNNGENGWQGELNSLTPTKAYKIKMQKEAVLELNGIAAVTTENTITFTRGWNWIGYVATASQSLEDALLNLQPETNDVIKGEDNFAVYDGTTWKGSLNTLIPGKGYMYYSQSVKSFNYAVRGETSGSTLNVPQWEYDPHLSEDNMIMVAELYDGEQKVMAGKYLVGIFVQDECRGVAVEKDGLLYICAHGELSDGKWSLRAFDVENNREYNVKEEITWSDNLVGTPNAPLKLHIGDLTGVASVYGGILIYPNPVYDRLYIGGVGEIEEISVSNMSGQTLLVRKQVQGHEGISVSALEEGFYLVRVKTDTGVIQQKILKRNQ